MVDAVEERHDQRFPDGPGRASLQRAEQPGRLHRHGQQVDGLDERRTGRRAGPGAFGAVLHLDAVDQQRRGGPLARDHRHVVTGRGQARREEDAHATGAEDRDPAHRVAAVVDLAVHAEASAGWAIFTRPVIPPSITTSPRR